jgi:hypothetical protein
MKLFITKRLLGIPVKAITVELPDVSVSVSVSASVQPSPEPTHPQTHTL